jgi:microcompartment protein CcmL/EutN
MRSEIKLRGVPSGREAEVLRVAIDQMQPGDLIVYWAGPIGECPRSISSAARAEHMAGRCLLVQRLIRSDGRPAPHTNVVPIRFVEYIAIKAQPK